MSDELDEEAEANPDELATFMALLDRVEDALAAVSDEDDRRMLAQIMRDAACIESETEGGTMSEDDEVWTPITGELARSTLAMFEKEGHDIAGARVEMGRGTRTKTSEGFTDFTPLRLVYPDADETAGAPDEQ